MRLIFLAGANSVHSYKWIKFFSKLNYEIVWVSFVKNEFEVLKGVRYFEVPNPKSIRGFFKCLLHLRKVIKIAHTDILHIHSIGSYGLIGLIISWRKDINIVTTPWGSDLIFGSKNIFKKIIMSKLLKRASLITCDADFMMDLVAKLIKSREKIKIINFGVDTNKFKPFEGKLNKIQLLDDYKIVSTRNFETIYDVETLIHACLLLREKIPNFKLQLIGKGAQKDYLQELVNKFQLEPKVEFMGQVSNDLLPKILGQSNVYVSTALSDAGIAASTAEAMACGLPVIITDTAENNSWIKEGKNGFLFQARNSADLCEKLTLVLNGNTIQKIGAQARKTILEKNDYQNEMKKMENLYLKLSKC